MANDDERREVARRLRRGFDNLRGARVGLLTPADVVLEIGRCVLVFDESTKKVDVSELFERLADLVDPDVSIGRMRHSAEDEQEAYAAMMGRKSVELHPVDRGALLDLADNLSRQAETMMALKDKLSPMSAGSCKAQASDFFDIASWIRKACGEEGK